MCIGFGVKYDDCCFKGLKMSGTKANNERVRNCLLIKSHVTSTCVIWVVTLIMVWTTLPETNSKGVMYEIVVVQL